MSAGAPAVVFVPGLLGFAELGVLDVRVGYFRGLRAHLARAGTSAHFAAFPANATIGERAQRLHALLANLPPGPVHLVAHSMGGLVSRLLAHHHDFDRRVRTIITVATPHRGSPLAEHVLNAPGPFEWLARRWLRRALEELTPQRCAQFNEQVPDRADVRYLSYAGVRTVAEMPLWMRPWTRYLTARAGDNDSQVPLSSAVWGEFQGILRADHLELVGWSLGLPERRNERPFDHLRFFGDLVAELSRSP